MGEASLVAANVARGSSGVFRAASYKYLYAAEGGRLPLYKYLYEAGAK